MERKCGPCTLCCKLLPMQEAEQAKAEKAEASMRQAGFVTWNAIPIFDKPAGARCPHQRRTGCMVYERRPFGCRYWNCAWLSGEDTADLRRPDHVHYVIDPAPDYIVNVNNETGARTPFPVVQVWVDPDYPDAHRDPALRAFIDRRGREGCGAIIRYSSDKAFFLVPPSLADDGQWHEVRDNTQIDRTRQYDLKRIAAVLSGESPA